VALKVAIDAGEYDRASALLDVLLPFEAPLAGLAAGAGARVKPSRHSHQSTSTRPGSDATRDHHLRWA
jgi:hypothetical protein